MLFQFSLSITQTCACASRFCVESLALTSKRESRRIKTTQRYRSALSELRVVLQWRVVR